MQKDCFRVADCLSDRLIIFVLREILPYFKHRSVFLQQRMVFGVKELYKEINNKYPTSVNSQDLFQYPIFKTFGL